MRGQELVGILPVAPVDQRQMDGPLGLQLGQHFGLLGGHQQGDSIGQFLVILLVHRLTGVGVIAGGGGNTDNLHILQLSGDNGLALLLVVRGDHRHNVAALQLAGEPLRKTFDGHGDGLLAPVQAVQVGVFRCWGV